MFVAVALSRHIFCIIINFNNFHSAVWNKVDTYYLEMIFYDLEYVLAVLKVCSFIVSNSHDSHL